MQAQSQIAHLKNSSQFFLCPYPRFFFIKKNNLQVGVSGWRGGGVQIRKSMALYVYVYQDACKCIL